MAVIHAYIDESGDDGIKAGSSDWFVLTALMIPARSGPALGLATNRVKQRVGRQGKTLHWRELSHSRKKAVIDELKTEDFVFTSVLTDKRHPEITTRGLRGKRLYFYSFRLLVERISWFTDEFGRGEANSALLFPETRTHLSYDELKDYLSYIQTLPDCQIRPNTIADVAPRPKGSNLILQLSDSVSGAVYDAVQFKYGTIEEGYLLGLADKLYRRQGRLWGYGLKVQPYKRHEVPSLFLNMYPWMSKI